LGLADGDRVLPLIEQLFGIVALFACSLESDAGEGAEGHVLALAAETVAVEPQLGPVGPHHDAEALAVGHRVFLVRRRRVADFRVAQFVHGKAPLPSGGPPVYPPLQCTHSVPERAGCPRTAANRTGHQYTLKCLILREFLQIDERARTRKNEARKANGARGGIEFCA